MRNILLENQYQSFTELKESSCKFFIKQFCTSLLNKKQNKNKYIWSTFFESMSFFVCQMRKHPY
jgi:hypothetical protein